MTRPGTSTEYRWTPILAGLALLALGVVALGFGITRANAWGLLAGDAYGFVFGWGAFVEAVQSIGLAAFFSSSAIALRGTMDPLMPARFESTFGLALGTGLWLLGLGLVAAGTRHVPRDVRPSIAGPPPPLYPRLKQFRDFYWSTLASYGLGILVGELSVVFTFLVSVRLGMPPVAAFSLGLLLGFGLTFAGGFLGAVRAGRLSIPELTIAIIYLGTPVPALLGAMERSPQALLGLSIRLRELSHLARQLGDQRPEFGYWLVFAGLVLILFLGVAAGFVATSSGKLDLRLGFELFVSNRHVSVFRPRLLLGAFAVLILGIIPPLLVAAVLFAAQAAVERTRIRALGLSDALEAAEALNHVKATRQTPTAMMTALSVGGVGVGVMALIIVLSVMSGFEVDLQSKILGTNAHGIVKKYGDSIADYERVMEKIRKVEGVAGLTPFIYNEVMVYSEGNISGAIIKGIDPATVGSVTDLPKYMNGRQPLDWLEEPERIRSRLAPEGGAIIDFRPKLPSQGKPAELERDLGERPALEDPMIQTPAPGEPEVVLPGIILGRELAAQLRVVVGDRVNVMSPLGGELGPQGPTPKSRPFRVAGIFYSGMFEYDSKMVYIHLREAQSFFGVKGATGIELKVTDIDDARRVTKTIYERLEGYPYQTKDWGEMNRNLFSALRLEKLVMAIILSIIVIVAAGMIVATVIMLVLEKRKEIAVLKALGVSDGGVVKIFLAEGLQIGVAGGLLGLLAGLAWCFFIEKVGIKLDPEVYYIPALPVRIEPIQTGLAVIIAVLVSFLASIYPALKASQVEPVEGLKAE